MAVTNQFCTLKPAKFGISVSCNCNTYLDDTIGTIKQESMIRHTDRQRRERATGFRPVDISDIIINRNGKELTEYDDRVLPNQSYGSLSRRKKDRVITNVERLHQRSRSVGNDNHFSLCLSPCKQSLRNMTSSRYSNYPGGIGGNSGSNVGGGGLLNPFKATKKFFKKIYDTATLPNRLHSKVLASSVTEQSEIPTTSLSPQHSFLDASYSLELPDDELPDQCDHNSIANQDATNSCIIASHDFDSTPSTMKPMPIIDDPMNDSGLSRSISSSDSQKTSSGDFRSWDDVFNHLKREMAYMRQRDAKIFADLQFVELQLRNVKNQAMAKSEYAMSNKNSSNDNINNNNNNSININSSNDGRILDKRQIKLGDLVESMPL
ncbi:unnamed protein product [Cercopithifilaria johnstoni]|uniref:Uncharacterized protein n=1 Tax=Cercopithifilaria johnstoni TaxID=2874296 RepID=A0A8J2LZW1_9BILA|nr:unnamed protein product [Cercopithifilaria johnstoni]